MPLKCYWWVLNSFASVTDEKAEPTGGRNSRGVADLRVFHPGGGWRNHPGIPHLVSHCERHVKALCISETRRGTSSIYQGRSVQSDDMCTLRSGCLVQLVCRFLWSNTFTLTLPSEFPLRLQSQLLSNTVVLNGNELLLFFSLPPPFVTTGNPRYSTKLKRLLPPPTLHPAVTLSDGAVKWNECLLTPQKHLKLHPSPFLF